MSADAPIFQEGDTVRVRNTYGLWKLVRLILVADEAEVRRGRVVRHVPVDQLEPVEEGKR